jgi:peptidyl-tRNA hydrolase, PTH1 family
VSEFRLIVGLGNPGPRYASNRHNIGFQTVDEVAGAYGLAFTRTEHQAKTVHGLVEGRRVILAKPQTWMNDSGKAVAPLAHFYKIEPENLLVVYDDLDIPLGTLRFRTGGSSGGHRGVQSIMRWLGEDTFPRLRIGIGRPPGQMDAAAYVLQDFAGDETPLLWEVMRTARDLVRSWVLDEPEWQRQGMTWRIEADPSR